jgi:hypothetical protein
LAAALASTTAAVLAAALPAGAAGPAPTVLQGAPGIAVAGGAHVVAAKQAGGSTLIRLVRDRDAKVLRSRVLPSTLGVPMITFSGDVEGTWARGRRLVLATSVYDDPSRTRFVTLDTRTLEPLRTITLRGSFAFDALSPDGRRLYVLHYPQGVNGGIRYVVRSVDLRAGRLEPGAIVDKTEPAERMSGIALTRAWSGSGTWAYTLYNGGDSHAFVHALNTRSRTARCIELPWEGKAQSVLDGARLVVNAAGILTLADRRGTLLARIDTRSFAVTLPGGVAAPSS